MLLENRMFPHQKIVWFPVTIPNQSDFRKSDFMTIYYETELNKKI